MKKALKLFAIILAVIILDQVSKDYLLYMVSGSVPVTGNALDIVPFSWIITRVTSFFYIVFTWNHGASFSMFRNLGMAAPFVLACLTGLIIGFIGYYTFRRARAAERVPLAFILGGALGNLIDRIRFGAVIDFLDFHIGNWHYPSFNVADICITIGVGLYLLNWFLARRNNCNVSKDGK